MRVSVAVLALWILEAGCFSSQSCPKGTYPLPEGGCAPIEDGDDDDDNGDDDDDNNGDDDDDDDDTSFGDDDDDDDGGGAQVGDTCRDDSDCESGGLFCVFESIYDAMGICTETCSSWSDCSESFWGCCDIGYGGSACIPDDWIERAGIECN